MARKCYISFKTEDLAYKTYLQERDDIDFIDKSLNVAIDSTNEDYILQTIRSEYLSDSTVTLHLIGLYGPENRGAYEQRFIKRELQASLYDGAGNPKNGILGVVLPSAVPNVFGNDITCTTCGQMHHVVYVNDTTTIKEFSYNYWIPNNNCCHTEDERYCVLVAWDAFVTQPNDYIEAAFAKRGTPISAKTRVYP